MDAENENTTTYSVQGIILANTVAEAYALRLVLFDRRWIATSPRAVRRGSLRGVEVKPQLVLYGITEWRSILPELELAFRHQKYAVYRVLKLR